MGTSFLQTIKMDAPLKDQPTFEVKFCHFKSLSTEEKEDLKKKSKSESTNKATKTWVNCLEDNLYEKALPKIDDIDTDDLPKILYGFYAEVTKKKETGGCNEYKNLTLKFIRAGINTYVRQK